MFKKLIRGYAISIVFFLVFVFDAFGSHWTQEVFSASITLKRIGTIAVYLPFIIAIISKFISDIKGKAIFIGRNKLFYAFAIYYSLVTAYRFITHGEYKESLYFFIVIMGSIAFIMLMQEKRFLSLDELINNAIVCCIIIAVYRVLIMIIVPRLFSYPPVNSNIISSLALLCFSLFSFNLSIQRKEHYLTSAVLLLISMTITLTTGSRASFLLLIALIVVTSVRFLSKNKKILLYYGGAVMASFVLVTALSIVNIGGVRASVVREIWFLNRFIGTVEVTTEEPMPQEDETELQNQQIERSDIGRKELVLMGVQQIKNNPVFGTGDVLYQQKISKSYTANQTSHCFLIESFACFGIVGTILCMSLVFSLFLQSINRHKGNIRYFTILTLIVHLIFCLVQPLFFDPIISIVFSVVICCFSINIEKTRTDESGLLIGCGIDNVKSE